MSRSAKRGRRQCSCHMCRPGRYRGNSAVERPRQVARYEGTRGPAWITITIDNQVTTNRGEEHS